MMQCFDDVFKNININIFGDVLQNAKHRAHNESTGANRPPLMTPTPIDDVTLTPYWHHSGIGLILDIAMDQQYYIGNGLAMNLNSNVTGLTYDWQCICT